MHLKEIREQMRACACGCARWSWGLDSLTTGVLFDEAGHPHHPSCRCASGVIGCHGDVVSGVLPGPVEKHCRIHGTAAGAAGASGGP